MQGYYISIDNMNTIFTNYKDYMGFEWLCKPDKITFSQLVSEVLENDENTYVEPEELIKCKFKVEEEDKIMTFVNFMNFTINYGLEYFYGLERINNLLVLEVGKGYCKDIFRDAMNYGKYDDYDVENFYEELLVDYDLYSELDDINDIRDCLRIKLEGEMNHLFAVEELYEYIKNNF